MKWSWISLVFWMSLSLAQGQEAQGTWKAGVATRVITPQKNIWMAGYASRKEPAAGKAQDLFAKALALEDPRGERFVIVTFDLVGITRAMRDEIARQAEKKYRSAHRSPISSPSSARCFASRRQRSLS